MAVGDPVVGPDMVVSVAYRLRDEGGACVDEVSRDEPLSFLVGYAQIVPGLEAGLLGAAAGERREIELGPEDAFGERDEEALLEVDRLDFPGGDSVERGDEVMSQRPDGVEVAHRVVEVSPEAVLIDLNHPLAGQRVRFEVEVLGVRPASDEELDRALAEVDELIVDAEAIGYGTSASVSRHHTPGEGAEAPPGGEAAGGTDLIQLRLKH
ncbi:MAG: peptidylprolyl isomerase [Myxococcales bacterium]|nr:peptidylprolyl isomerase [Myxococcales bacterium]